MPQSIEKMTVQPWFDMEQFMALSQETRMDGPLMDRCMALWKQWSEDLLVQCLLVDEKKYLLVVLGDSVENAVDAAWDKAPAEAFFLNALAQTLCMCAVHDVLPEVQEAGCAPSPRVSESLRQALETAGVPYQGQGPSLSRRFAVVTHYPFKGGCEICALKDNCPKAGGGVSSVLLPGHQPA